MHIQQEFRNGLKLDLFKEIDKKSFLGKNGIVSKYAEIDTGIKKLRVKYKARKQDWSRTTDSIKNGSRLSTNKEPRWFKPASLVRVFFEANETISLYLSVTDTSFVNERNESHVEHEGSSYSESENPAEFSEHETQINSFSLKLSSDQLL